MDRETRRQASAHRDYQMEQRFALQAAQRTAGSDSGIHGSLYSEERAGNGHPPYPLFLRHLRRRGKAFYALMGLSVHDELKCSIFLNFSARKASFMEGKVRPLLEGMDEKREGRKIPTVQDDLLICAPAFPLTR